MGLDDIRQAIAEMTAEELYALKAVIDGAVGTPEVTSQAASPQNDAPAGAESGPDRPRSLEKRSHQRFDVCLPGSARPLVVAAGARERTFPITIVDLSKSGMRFRVDASAPLYPLSEVVFTGPTGRMRNVFVKMVRMRMIFGDGEANMCEIAAHSVDPTELSAVQERQRRIRATHKTVACGRDIPVVLIGPDRDQAKHAESVVSGSGYPAVTLSDYARLAEALQPTGPQVVVHLDGRQALLHRDLMAELRKDRPELAAVAVFESTDHRRELLEAEVDECVHAINATALLTMYIKRAVKTRLLAADADSPLGPVNVLLHVQNNLQLAQLGMSSHRDNVNVSFSYDTEGMLSLLRCADVHAVVLDSGAARKNDWDLLKRLRREFVGVPLLVAVEDAAAGPEAVCHGATEYLQLPAKRQDLITLVHTSRRAEEFESAQRAAAADEKIA